MFLPSFSQSKECGNQETDYDQQREGWGGGDIIDFYFKEALELISEGEGGRANIICERSLREAVKKYFF